MCQGRGLCCKCNLGGSALPSISTVCGRQELTANLQCWAAAYCTPQQTAASDLSEALSCAHFQRPRQGKRYEISCSLREGRRDMGQINKGMVSCTKAHEGLLP